MLSWVIVVGLRHSKESEMSQGDYEEINDDGPGRNDRRVETATRAVKHATRQITHANWPACVGIYMMGAEGFGREVRDIEYTAHADENIAHQLVEGVEGVEGVVEPTTLEASQSMINDGITHVSDAWNLFTAVGQAQVVNPVCNFFNGLAQAFLAQTTQASQAERTPLRQASTPLYDPDSFGPQSQKKDDEDTDEDTDKTKFSQ